jgi:hypothetical protein
MNTRCFKEDALAAVVQIAGLEEVEIVKLLSGGFHLRVKVKSHVEPFYVATQRHTNEPRLFKKIDAVVAVAVKLFGEDCRFVVRSEPPHQI